MKEINLVKAKSKKTGEWIEGYYLESFTGTQFLLTVFDHILGMSEIVEIIEDSECHFIGLPDSEGSNIYENHIVEFIYCPKSLNEKIVGKISKDQWGNPVVDDGKGLYHIENATKGKIIGNIFDNPELLGVAN